MTQAQFVGRLEDARLLTGKGTYTSDWNFPGQTYAVFLRSDRAHAEIVSMDTAAAKALPGVLGVFTHEDVKAAGFRPLPIAMPDVHRDGRPVWKPHRPILAHGRVRYVGECVACVVATSAQTAQDALELIQVEYNDLPVVTQPVAALQPGAPNIHSEIPGNVALDWETGDAAKTEEAFARAAHRVSITVHNNRVTANPLEPRACAATYDEATGMHLLYCCNQGVGNQIASLSAISGIPQNKLNIIARDVGGGFGARVALYPEYAAAVLAARLLKRPVKWTGTRAEVFLNDDHARDCTQRGELALDADLKFLAMRFNFVQAMGAYVATTGINASTRVASTCLTGVYDVPVAYFRTRAMVVNTTSTSAYRGSGRPLMSYVLERLVDQAAIELKVDPVELRRRNLVASDKFPYKLAAQGTVYDCGDFEGVLQRALEKSDWAGFDARLGESKRRGKLRGRGIANFIEGTGPGGSPTDEVMVRFDPDGTIALYAAAQSQGQSHETTFAQIVSNATGIPMTRFVLRSGDGTRLVGHGAGGSRTILGAGSVFSIAGGAIVEKGRKLAADALEAAPEDLQFEQGEYRIKGTDRKISMTELIDRHKGMQPHPLDTKSDAFFGATYPNSCHVCEVEIDPDTGVVEVMQYSGVDDAGTIINHQVVEGQMHGGTMQGAGQVLGELSHYDPENGQLVTGSFMDYPMPRATTFIEPQLEDRPTFTKTNPLGAKGVGESGVTGALPTVMNAVLDAMRRAGVTHFDMPASPQRVWRALQEAKAGHPKALSVESAGLSF